MDKQTRNCDRCNKTVVVKGQQKTHEIAHTGWC